MNDYLDYNNEDNPYIPESDPREINIVENIKIQKEIKENYKNLSEKEESSESVKEFKLTGEELTEALEAIIKGKSLMSYAHEKPIQINTNTENGNLLNELVEISKPLYLNIETYKDEYKFNKTPLEVARALAQGRQLLVIYQGAKIIQPNISYMYESNGDLEIGIVEVNLRIRSKYEIIYGISLTDRLADKMLDDPTKNNTWQVVLPSSKSLPPLYPHNISITGYDASENGNTIEISFLLMYGVEEELTLETLAKALAKVYPDKYIPCSGYIKNDEGLISIVRAIRAIKEGSSIQSIFKLLTSAGESTLYNSVITDSRANYNYLDG